MEKNSYRIGDEVLCHIAYANETFTAKIIGIGTHKGHRVYDLNNERFVYESQIILKF